MAPVSIRDRRVVGDLGNKHTGDQGAGSKTATLAMAYKLLASAQERWRRFNGHELVVDVLDGAKFKDGIRVTDDDNHDDRQQTEEVAA